MRFSIIKIRTSIIFMHLLSIQTSEISQKIGGLDGKTEQNCLKMQTLRPFSFKKKKKKKKKKTLYLLKNGKHK